MGDEVTKAPAAPAEDQDGVLIPFEVAGVGVAYLSREDLAAVLHHASKRAKADAEAPADEAD